MIACDTYRGAMFLTFCSPPVNAISFAMLDELLDALRKAAADAQIRGVVITGGPEHFSAGADLRIFQDIRSPADAVHASRVFQEAFGAIEDSAKPVVAALAGHVLGGALELALACHFRLAVEGSRFGMPEVNLGINPGAGGTQRLPRLIGLEPALEMLLGGRPINLARALELGLIDVACPAERLRDAAVDLLESHRSIRKTSALAAKVAEGGKGVRNLLPERPDQPSVGARCFAQKVPDPFSSSAWARFEKQLAAVRPELIAPRKILEAVRTGVEDSFPAGLRREQEAFRQCMATRATQNKIYVFCASRQTTHIPELQGVAAERIDRAGVLGMGTMGAGIAQALIVAGLNTTACDLHEAALTAGAERIRASLARRVVQGKLAGAKAEAALARLATTLDLHWLADAQLVVEAVFEDLSVKRAAIARLEEVCSADTIIASNTSTLNLDLLAAEMRHPQRLVGLHFFHPAQQMPLVEVVRRRGTPPGVVASTLAMAKALGKTPVLVENREGFVVNRLFIPYLMEAFWLLEEGVSPAEIDRAMVDFGFAMGPLQLIDMSGLDILEKTQAIMQRAFPHHGELAPIARRLVEGGHLGQKTGAGVYRYEPGDRTPRPHEVTEQAVAAARRQRGLTGGGFAPDQIVSRLMLRMVTEAFALLEEKVVRRPADIDVAMVLGTGLADFRGGVVRYAGDLGWDRVVAELRRLSQQCGQRYLPGRLLAEAAQNPGIFNPKD